MTQIDATRDQIEATIEALRDRSSEALGAVQHGVGAITSKIGSLVEPEPKRTSRSKFWWMLLAMVGVSVAVYVVSRRSRDVRENSGSDDTVPWNDRAAGPSESKTSAPSSIRTA